MQSNTIRLVIAPGLPDDFLNDGWTYDKKVIVFKNRVLRWQLQIAGDLLLNNIPHRGFAQLLIVLSYFEMIARYREGNTTNNDAGKWFKKGIRYVFDRHESHLEEQLEAFYLRVRNGLYHMGMIRHDVILIGGLGAAWKYDKGVIWIDPDEMVASLVTDLNKYSALIENPIEKQLRDNFTKRFNYDNGIAA